MKPTDRKFEELALSILEGVTPADGVAVLLCKHPIGSVYFPVTACIGSAVRGHWASLVPSYYIYSTCGDRIDGTEPLILDRGSSTELLLRYGKLAVRLFHDAPVAVSYHGYDANSPFVLGLLTRDVQSPPPPSSIVRAICCLAELWADIAMRVDIIGSEPGEIVSAAGEYLSDAGPEPPYSGCLHARIDLRGIHAGGEGFKPGQVWTNALAYNCFLLAHHESLASSFIEDMICTAGDQPYVHPVPKTADPVAVAISRVCTDVVFPLASLNGSRERLLARLNVPSSLLAETSISGLGLNSGPKQVATSWDLIRTGLEFLENRHPASALVTVWLGSAADRGAVELALPLGFNLGQKHSSLQTVPDRTELQSLRDESFESEVFRISLIRLRVPLSDDVVLGQETDELVSQIANAATTGLARLSNGFVGPLVLDFQKSAVKSLLIYPGRRKKSEMLAKTIPSASRTYKFLQVLAQGREARSPEIPYATAAGHLDLTAAKMKTVVDSTIRRELGRPPFPINWRSVFLTRQKLGWVLVDDVAVEGLPAEWSGARSRSEIDGEKRSLD